MLDGPESRFNRATRAFIGLDVSGDFEAGISSFTDEEFEIFQCVRVGLAVDADFNDFGAEQNVLPEGFDNLIVSVGIDVFRVTIL